MCSAQPLVLKQWADEMQQALTRQRSSLQESTHPPWCCFAPDYFVSSIVKPVQLRLARSFRIPKSPNYAPGAWLQFVPKEHALAMTRSRCACAAAGTTQTSGLWSIHDAAGLGPVITLEYKESLRS